MVNAIIIPPWAAILALGHQLGMLQPLRLLFFRPLEACGFLEGGEFQDS